MTNQSVISLNGINVALNNSGLVTKAMNDQIPKDNSVDAALSMLLEQR